VEILPDAQIPLGRDDGGRFGEPALVCEHDGLRTVAETKLGEDARHVGFHGCCIDESSPEFSVLLRPRAIAANTSRSRLGEPFETRGHPSVVGELGENYESQHDLSTLSRRNEEMLSIGPELHALRRRQLRTSSGGSVGRNAPCPCGSGQKYKKCCGRS